MIYIKYFNRIVAALLLVAITSCKKEFPENIINNPNDPSDVTPAALLPSIEASIAYTQGGDMSRFTSVFMQQVTGVSRQFGLYNIYSFTDEDFDNLWRFNIYGGPLVDLRALIDKSEKNGYKHYEGVSKILMAYMLGMTSDFFGDIPYSDAFKGNENLKPKYDTQQNIYQTIQKLLDEGIVALKIPAANAGALRPGVDDMIYGGNTGAWIKAANALIARFAIHQTKINASAAQKALDALNKGAFTKNADDLQFKFGTSETFSNPWYQYNSQRADIAFSGYLADTMESIKDPRLLVYVDTSDYSMGAYFGANSSPVFLMTYAEQKFIEAEAHTRLNNVPGAQAAYTEAIKASMEKLQVPSSSIDAYLAVHGTIAGTQAQMLYKILFQKYLALYTHPEVWTDWRRTGVPALKPVTGAVLNEIPRRFMYPQTERLYNSANTPPSTLLSPRVWWDK